MRPPASWNSARATLVIAGGTAAAWLLVGAAGLEQQAVLWGAFIPLRVSGALADGRLAAVALTPLTATLVHADFLHLAFNLLFLLVCGRAVEPILGVAGVAILYLLGAFAAAAAFWAATGGESGIMIGAGGAVSALVGAYPMFFGRHRIRIASNALALVASALWLGSVWIVLQMLVGLASSGGRLGAADLIGLAAADLAGFLIGLLLARPLLMLRWRKA